MSYIVWPSEPKLITTGLIKYFTKTVVYDLNLEQQTLVTFFEDWKLLTPEEASKLYYGKVYRLKDISPNHLILQTRRRRGVAYHYIDCKYRTDKAKVVMEIKTPNLSAYFYIFWPLIVLLFLMIFGNPFGLEYSIYSLGLFLIYAVIAILAGVFFLKCSIYTVKVDLERALLKIINS